MPASNSKSNRFRIRLKVSMIPNDLVKAKARANQLANASGLHRNTFVRAFTGEQIGEPFIAAFLALNPKLTFEDAFEIVAPENHHNVPIAAYPAGTRLRANLPNLDIIESYPDGVNAGVPFDQTPNDGEMSVTATVLVTKDTEWEFTNKKVKPLCKGDVVPVIRWYKDGRVAVFPALRVPAIKEQFANALLAHGFDPDRIRWVEGSEPNQAQGRVLGPRHKVVTDLGQPRQL